MIRTKKIEKVLRSGFFWAIVFPFLIALTVGIIGGAPISLMLLLGIPTFPFYILKGVGIEITYIPIVFQIVGFLFYLIYALFIIKVKKMDKKLLFWLTVLIILIVILGIKGCIQEVSTLS